MNFDPTAIEAEAAAEADRPHDSIHLLADLARAQFAINRALAWIDEWAPPTFRSDKEQADFLRLIQGRDHIWAMRQKLDPTLKD